MRDSKGFTLVELMIVSVIMIMVTGIVYSFYINVNRMYARGADTLLAVQDAQTLLELISKEVRSAAEIIELKPNSLVFQKYYDEPDPNYQDPTSDLNRIKLKTIHYRLVKSDDGFYHFERKEDIDSFVTIHPGFKYREVHPSIFSGWRLEGNRYVPYNHERHKPDLIPIIEIRIALLRKEQPFELFKKVFVPVLYGKLPILRVPISIEEQTGS